jgi:DNA-binding NarL/FixJ family response regulator
MEPGADLQGEEYVYHPSPRFRCHGHYGPPEGDCPLCTLNVTPRDIELLQCLADGLTLEKTAKRLYVCISTVKEIQRRMLKRNGFHTRAQAVAHAVQAGVIKVTLPGDNNG